MEIARPLVSDAVHGENPRMASYRFDEFELQTDLFELRRNGDLCPMEPQVFTVLAYLVEHHDRVVSKTELIDHVWHDRFISEAALTSRLMAARKVLGDSGQEQRYIKTVHGRGYRFVADVAGSTTAALPAAPDAGAGSDSELRQEIRFCTSADGTRIAYASSGSGPPLVKAAHWLSHLEFDWESPVWRHWMVELSRTFTLARYDERGSGLSDWNVNEFSLDAFVARSRGGGRCDAAREVSAAGHLAGRRGGHRVCGPPPRARHEARAVRRVRDGTQASGDLPGRDR